MNETTNDFLVSSNLATVQFCHRTKLLKEITYNTWYLQFYDLERTIFRQLELDVHGYLGLDLS